MNRHEIIKALRQFDRDIRELGQSPITKSSAAQLLRSENDGKGGPLVQWFNSEKEDRTKSEIREVIRLVTQAGYADREEKTPQAVKQLGPLIDRLAESVGAVAEADEWVRVRTGDCRRLNKSTLKRHAESEAKPWIEKSGRGWYRIRQSHLNEYQ